MVKLEEISWTKSREVLAETDMAILPVGSTEQHGPHSPLGTDSITAETVAEIIGDRTGLPVLPLIPVGVSDHHRQFHGTLWVSQPVFRSYVMDVILSAVSHGVNRVLIVNGHGGNTASLYEVAEVLRAEYNVICLIVHSYTAKLDGHAGRDETSILLTMRPELVDMSIAPDETQKTKLGSMDIKGLNKIGPSQFPWDTLDLSETGVFGPAGRLVKASEATVERGRELIDPHIDKIVEVAQQLRDAELETLLSKSHKD